MVLTTPRPFQLSLMPFVLNKLPGPAALRLPSACAVPPCHHRHTPARPHVPQVSPTPSASCPTKAHVGPHPDRSQPRKSSSMHTCSRVRSKKNKTCSPSPTHPRAPAHSPAHPAARHRTKFPRASRPPHWHQVPPTRQADDSVTYRGAEPRPLPTRSPARLAARSSTHTHKPPQSPTHPPARPPAHPPTHLPTHPLTHPHTMQQLTHPPKCPPTHTPAAHRSTYPSTCGGRQGGTLKARWGNETPTHGVGRRPPARAARPPVQQPTDS